MEMDISGYNGQNQVVETYDSQAIQVPQDWTPPFLEQTTNLNHLRSLLYLIVLTDVSVQKPRLMADLSSSWRHCFREVVALDVQLGNFDLEDGPGSSVWCESAWTSCH